MRSLKLDRKARGEGVRARATRKSPRSPRENSAKAASSRRQKDRSGPFSRIGASISRFFRRPIFLASAGLVLLLLLVGLFVSGVIGRTVHNVQHRIHQATAEAGFGISEIHLSGNSRVPPETILAALNMQPGDSIFDADLVGARARIMALDWIQSADVVRRYPDAIFVTLVEKRPFALWQSPGNGTGRIAVVERSGEVITTRDVQKFARLPKLVGEGAPAAAADIVDAVLGHRAAAARVAAYEYVSQRRWNLILNNGVVVKLPEIGWQNELNALEHLIVDTGILERDVTEIDLRSPTQYFFVLRGGEKKDVQRGKET
jgi:cell division protein FtsQ